MAVERPSADWMWELPLHYERMRRAYPDHQLCIVFDIDGTILDVRYLLVHALLAYDREHATRYFQGLRAEDVTVHEHRIDKFLEDLGPARPGPRRRPGLVRRAPLEPRGGPRLEPALPGSPGRDPVVAPAPSCSPRRRLPAVNVMAASVPGRCRPSSSPWPATAGPAPPPAARCRAPGTAGHRGCRTAGRGCGGTPGSASRRSAGCTDRRRRAWASRCTCGPCRTYSIGSCRSRREGPGGPGEGSGEPCRSGGS
jgi:hypothetical protein